MFTALCILPSYCGIHHEMRHTSGAAALQDVLFYSWPSEFAETFWRPDGEIQIAA